MTTTEVFLRCGPGETRLALTEDGRLQQVLVDREGAASEVGAIFLGRVSNIVKGMNAAFVDLGVDRPGFLAAQDAQVFDRNREQPKPIDSLFTEGQSILVQVVRDGFDDKGPKLTTRVNLSSLNLILTSGRVGLSISRKIDDQADRDRLEDALEDLLPTDAGFIVRTRALSVSADDLRREADDLINRWSVLKSVKEARKKPGELVAAPAPLLAFFAEHYSAGWARILADDRNVVAKLKKSCSESLPEVAALLQFDAERQHIFDWHDLEDQWQQILSPEVALPSGGSIIIEETAALTAIDVNTGAQQKPARTEDANLAVNLEAAAEILRHIRLRNLSGQILIDFLPQRSSDNRDRVAAAVEAAAGSLIREINFFGFTRLGLFELTRRRRGISLSQLFYEQNRLRKTPQSLALEALQSARSIGSVAPGAGITITAPPAVADHLTSGPASSHREALAAWLGRPIEVVAESSHSLDSVTVTQTDA